MPRIADCLALQRQIALPSAEHSQARKYSGKPNFGCSRRPIHFYKLAARKAYLPNDSKHPALLKTALPTLFATGLRQAWECDRG